MSQINKEYVEVLINKIDTLLENVSNEIGSINNNISKEYLQAKKKEMEIKIEKLKREADYYNALQNALKLILNGTYGAFTTVYFILYVIAVASSITAQGRDLTQSMDKFNEYYWYKLWHNDIETHNKMFIRNIKQIKKTDRTNTSIYCDTDSVSGNSIVTTTSGRKTIEEFYNENINNTSETTTSGHESVLCEELILDYSEERGLYYGEIERIIRHKVSKPRWRIETESGKHIDITDDHSIIIYRDGKEHEIKASEIIDGDEVIAINTLEDFEVDLY
jgi:DNA polymerase elongation subunit (family B)